MKKNKRLRNEAAWDDLVARYFEAQTTPAEEERLRRFLTSPRGADARYDDVRAVMGYLAVGRSQARRPRRQRRPLRPAAVWRVAAAVCLVAGLTATLATVHYRRENVCVAYVSGQKETDPDAVMRYMEAAFSETVPDEAAPTMESQLNSMFQSLDNP